MNIFGPIFPKLQSAMPESKKIPFSVVIIPQIEYEAPVDNPRTQVKKEVRAGGTQTWEQLVHCLKVNEDNRGRLGGILPGKFH